MVTGRKEIALKYLKTSFIPDLLSILPLEVFSFFSSNVALTASYLRLNRCIRCYKVWTFLCEQCIRCLFFLDLCWSKLNVLLIDRKVSQYHFLVDWLITIRLCMQTSFDAFACFYHCKEVAYLCSLSPGLCSAVGIASSFCFAAITTGLVAIFSPCMLLLCMPE